MRRYLPRRFGAYIFILVCYSAFPGGVRCQEVLSQDSAEYELALTLKTSADQKFLSNDKEGAAQLYGEALEQANLISTDSTDVNTTQRLLLTTDIEYRQSLLKHGLEFWGSSYSLTPDNPVAEFSQLNESFTAFTKDIGVMSADLSDANGAKTNQATFNGLVSQTDTGAAVARLQQGKAGIAADYYSNQLALFNDRVSQDIDRQNEIGRETQQLIGEESAKRAALDSLIAKSLTSSIGLPVDLTSIAGKPLDQQVLSIGSQLISDGDSDLVQGLSKFSDTTSTLLRYYQDAQQIAQEVNNDVQTAQKLGLLLRNPSIETLQQVGGAIFSHLDAATQEQWRTFVTQSKPFASLLQLSQTDASIRDALSAYLVKKQDLANYLNPILGALETSSDEELAKLQQNVLTAVGSVKLSEQDSKRFFEFILTSYTGPVLSSMSSDIKQSILTAASVANVDELHMKLVNAGLSGTGLGNVSVNGNFIVLSLPASLNVTLELPKIIDQMRLAQPNLAKNQISSTYNRLVQGLDSKNSNALVVFVKQIVSTPYSNLLMQYADSAKDTVNQAQIYGDVIARLSDGDRNAAISSLANIAVGADFRQKSNYAPSPQSTDATPQNGKGGQDQELLKAAATTLIGAAVPGAGAAIAVVSMLSDLQELDGLSERINKLYEEDKQLTKEGIQLQDMVREARFAHESALMDERIAQASFDGALAQGSIYRSALGEEASDQLQSVVKAKLMLPGLLFDAESLRRSFDGLERSLALWIGDPRETHGFLEDSVRKDPQYLRYILDEDIHLYDWLDRSVESTHVDLFSLRAHWDQLVKLSKTLCENNGCTKETAVLGSVNQTDILTVSHLVSTNRWQEFKAWQKNTAGLPFAFTFMLDPSQKLIDPSLENVRIVDARLAGVFGKDRTPLGQVTLRHSGVSYIPRSGTYFKEVFQPDEKKDLAWPKDDFDTDGLRLRWKDHGVSRNALEGYGLYTLWTLILQPTAQNSSLDDIVLRFAFQFKPGAAVVPPTADAIPKLRIYTDSRTYFDFAASELGVLGDPAQVSAEMKTWKTEKMDHGENFARIELVTQ